MRFLMVLAILIAGGMIGGAILYIERFQVWQSQPGLYLIHDTWTGDMTSCLLQGMPPETSIACAPVERRGSGRGP